MDDLDEIFLRAHDRVDRLVRTGGLVEHGGILAALDAGSGGGVIRDGEAAAGLLAGHRSPGTVAARFEALAVALTADDVRLRAHAARDDAELAGAGPHGALASHEDVAAEVSLARDVVVMTVDRLVGHGEGRQRPYRAERRDDRL